MTAARSAGWRNRLIALWVVTLMSGCVTSGRTNLFGSRVERLELIEVTVENEDSRDREVFAYWEDRNLRVRLGVVPGRSTETFTTPWWSHGVKFTASQRRQYYPVRPGDRVALVIGGATSMIPRRVRD